MMVTKSLGQNKMGVCPEESQSQIERNILQRKTPFKIYVFLGMLSCPTKDITAHIW
jgi:hypothetical protein